MNFKPVLLLGLLLLAEPAGPRIRAAESTRTAHVSRVRHGVNPEFVHGTPVQRGLNRILPKVWWQRLEAAGLEAPTRIRPAGKDGPCWVLELCSDAPLPRWSDLTLFRVYRELRAVRYQDQIQLDVGEVFPFEEQANGWYGYALFASSQPTASHLVIEVRYDAAQEWRPIMRVWW